MRRVVPHIEYIPTGSFFENYPAVVGTFIAGYQAKNILEVGAGANPSLSREVLIKLDCVTCTLLDISAVELAKAPEGYRRILADVSEPNLIHARKYDFIFSKMLMEHVKDAETMHVNIYNLLAPGGIAFHFFPTLFALPYAVNLLTPEWLSVFMLRLAHPERNSSGTHGKFPAHYSWCYGPLKTMIRLYENVGYDVLGYVGLFGHSYYYEKIPGVRKIHEWVMSFLLKHPNPLLTSYAYVVLRKPI